MEEDIRAQGRKTPCKKAVMQKAAADGDCCIFPSEDGAFTNQTHHLPLQVLYIVRYCVHTLLEL